MDTFETSSVVGILERTPHAEPYYSEVRNAVDKLHGGDPSHNPIYGIIHGYVGALAKTEKLGNDWTTHNVLGGVVVAHKDFLDIQNNFAILESDIGSGLQWNADICLEALGGYITGMQQYRLRHINLYNDSLQYLSPAQLGRIKDLTQKHQDFLEDKTDFLMVAIPFHLDNPKLWETFSLRGKILDRIAPWAKINEQGIILGSRIYRNDDPRGHDYFSYAARAVRSGEARTMSDKLLLTAQHEGSHGIVDALLLDLLKIEGYNPINEGLAGALGQDGRETKSSPSFTQLLQTPYPVDSKLKMDTAYIAGAKYWESLYRILQNRNAKSTLVWSKIFGAALGTAVDFSNNVEFMKSDTETRISRFLREVPKRLVVEMKDLESEYNSLTENTLS